ncbi:MAG: PEP-CTERM sorting domain-containing protein [Fimbriimonadaceae bacterium]|nr:PEP-CTERM sorting domain-containing protein [Fimbriimonadaceae bacterium]
MNRYIGLGIGVAMLTPSAFAISYFTDFESGVGAEWSTNSTFVFNGTTTLGRFSTGSTQLTLTGLNLGEVVTLSFDFYALDSWDGNSAGTGPDRLVVMMDSTTVLDSTFSNVGFNNQDYPQATGLGNNPRYTNADDWAMDAGGTLPNGYYGNSLYRFGGSLNPSFSTVATSSTMVINFTDFGLQGVGDESWSIDNVRVASVPEPASLLALGLGVLVLRRRKS